MRRVAWRRGATILTLVAIGLVAAPAAPGAAHAPHRPAVRRLDFVRLVPPSQVAGSASIALERRGNVFVASTTTSTTWPVRWTRRCVQQACTHGFILKLTADGSRTLYAIRLGGSTATSTAGIAVDWERQRIPHREHHLDRLSNETAVPAAVRRRAYTSKAAATAFPRVGAVESTSPLARIGDWMLAEGGGAWRWRRGSDTVATRMPATAALRGPHLIHPA